MVLAAVCAAAFACGAAVAPRGGCGGRPKEQREERRTPPSARLA
eukprot:gene13726-22121_t